MLVHDEATPLARRRTPEGFLRLSARIARAGLHDYKAGEIGGPPGAAPDTPVRVFRPPEEVFDAASQKSFAGKPVTSDHPPAMIDSANWTRYAVGHAGPTVERDGDHLATELLITDAAAVARAEAGAELSNGYWADFDFTPGTTPNGESYDAVQRNIRGNHIALVDAGRCGATCRTDAGGARDTGAALDAAADRRTVIVDGVTIETTPEGAAAIGRLVAAHDAARVAHRRDVEVRDGEIAALRAAAPGTVPDLDALVAERAAVLDAARRLLGSGFECRGRSVPDVRRTVVGRLLGAERARDRSDDYVAAAFDALASAGARSNPLAACLAASSPVATSRDAALADRNRYLADAWKGGDSQGDR